MFSVRSYINIIPGSIYSGLFLYLLLVALSLLNVRKKLSMLPIGKASTWLTAHVWMGFLSMFILLLHIGFRWPDGKLELTIFCLYWIVALSGVGGLLISRTAPQRLNDLGREVIYEDIPMLRRQLAVKARELALGSVQKTNYTTIATFYANELSDFFSGARNFWSYALMIHQGTGKIFSKFQSVRLYLDKDELAILNELEALIREKKALDVQSALQKILKLWLFVHIPLTYALMVFATMHAWLAWSFGGGR